MPVRCLEISSVERAHFEMARIGVDPEGIRIMAPKQFHYNLKIEGLTAPQANVIKQEMLSIGGEAAVAKGAASCSVDKSDALVSGTLKQFNTLIDKLKCQSFGLPEVGASLSEAVNNAQRLSFTFKGRSRQWALGARTLIMGILNVTPDSFSDGGLFFDREKALQRALQMASEGADWVDVGGESTRPGARPVEAEEELRRVIPVVGALSSKGIAVSIDTRKAEVARQALKAGAEIVNDISGLADKDMASVCAQFKAPVIIMHMRGAPETMQENVEYKDLVTEVYDYLLGKVECAKASGIDRDSIMIDPGLGFGKSREGNLELIKSLAEFRSIGCPVLVGPSRKSFIGKTLGADMTERLPGTIAASVACVLNGAHVLRVHDVKEARQAALMADAIKNAGT